MLTITRQTLHRKELRARPNNFHKTFKKLLWLQAASAACLILFLSLSCGDDSTPTAPEPAPSVVEVQLEYFPLREGSRWKYKYSDHYNFTKDRYPSKSNKFTNNYDGFFMLEVNKALEKNLGKDTVVFLQVTATFLIEKHEYRELTHGSADEVLTDTSFTRRDFTENTVFNLLYENDTLWYVDNAPDFERLDEGSRSPLISNNLADGGMADLKLFDYPGNSYLSRLKLNVAEDQIAGTPQDWYVWRYYGNADVIFSRNQGVSLIDLWDSVYSHQMQGDHRIGYTLLEYSH